MKYLNTGVHQICRNLQFFKIKEFGDRKYIYGQTSNSNTIQAITEYCAEREIPCNREVYQGWTCFEVEVNERGEPGWEARRS